MLAALDDHPVLSVSDLARQARLLIEERFNRIWVRGEISNLRRPGSGHWYFTLKDSGAQIRCAMFAGSNRQVRVAPTEGSEVILRGRVSLYEARGDFQIIAESLEPAGEGALRAAFDALKSRLEGEGLFAAERKRPLPTAPTHLAVISSPTGAALQDVLHVIERRFAALQVTLLPARVQGDGAEGDIIRALQRVEQLGADLVLLTRGGGSLEDLWTFNLESVARAVAASPTPTVVAVGHQTDFTIAEFAADLRAPTPSAAAELITPSTAELLQQLSQYRARISRSFATEIRHRRETVQRLRAQLQDPHQRLQQNAQRTDDLDERMRLAMRRQLLQHRTNLSGLTRTLAARRPEPLITRLRLAVHNTQQRLHSALNAHVELHRHRWESAARTLQAVSPLNTIGRGYAVLSEDSTGEWVTSATHAAPGSRLTAHLQDGSLQVAVTGHDPDNGLPMLPDFNATRSAPAQE
jgi:exodeoxyribonuclease VII large subunit